jgi:predicted AAA+ superfamily ATPase
MELLKFKIWDEGDLSIYSIPNSSPIYQNEITTLISGVIKVKQNSLHLLDNPGIKLKIMYSNGSKERIFNLLNILTFSGQLLNRLNWTEY